MASVFRKHNKYYVRWKDASRRWRRSVTACTTKRDAQRYGDDLEHKAERQAKGLEALPSQRPALTFGELFEWWWKEYGARQRGDTGSFLRKRLMPILGGLALPEVNAPRIEGLLQSHSAELSPKSLNALRGAVFTIFAKAIRRGLWTGPNPAAGVERRKVSRKVYDTLRAEEVTLLLAALAPAWRPLFACAIWTGMRKGELLGLQKVDVDLDLGTITIRHSYDSETTKGGHADVIPIADPLRPFLREAFISSRSRYVFPAADGSMRGSETDLLQVLQRAMSRAGLVEGWEHVCRRKGCGHREHAADAALRLCPKGHMKLWPKAIPRKLRFHDLRGTTATLLARAGVQLVVAQRILRHADPRITANVYTHVDIGDMLAGVNRMGIPNLIASQSQRIEAAARPLSVAANGRTQQRFSPTVAPRDGWQERDGNDSRGSENFSSETLAVDWSGRQDLNLRPPGPEPGALPG
jgi:integrase